MTARTLHAHIGVKEAVNWMVTCSASGIRSRSEVQALSSAARGAISIYMSMAHPAPCIEHPFAVCPLSLLHTLSNLPYAQTTRVGREHAFRWRERIQLAEERLLDGEVLDDRFDDELRSSSFFST